MRPVQPLLTILSILALAGLTACSTSPAPPEPPAAVTVAPSEATAPEPGGPSAGGLLAQVKARGELVCGVNDQLPGFGFLGSGGAYEGFDVDFCRAVAAAVLGDAAKVVFRPLTTQERFTALQTGEVDVLIRNTTWTLTRDTQNGLDFAPTTFYDGQGVMVPVSAGIDDLQALGGASICVQSGTTTEKNIGDAMRKLALDFTPVVYDDPEQTYAAYAEGRCDAVTSDKSQLIARREVLAEPAAHTILEATLSKEPLGPAVLQGDSQWADVVSWVVYGLVTAEELGITSANVREAAAGDDPEVRRFLGTEEALGEGLGLSTDFMVTVLEAVGNYAEIYDRNLGPATPFNLARGPNRLWTDGGLLYAPPFR
jgi:general L-amino acid transport system substrate-binding protein